MDSLKNICYYMQNSKNGFNDSISYVISVKKQRAKLEEYLKS